MRGPAISVDLQLDALARAGSKRRILERAEADAFPLKAPISDILTLSQHR